MSNELMTLFRNFSILPIGLVVALASGFVAYTTSYAGLRRGHSTQDALFISSGYALFALAVFEGMSAFPSSLRIIGALLFALVIGILWRKWLRGCWQWAMRELNVHRDDGIYGSWDKLLQENRQIGQVSVYTKNGHVLHLNDRSKYKDEMFGGLYLGGDESITMVVDEEEYPDGIPASWEDVHDEDWGVRFTHIPASEIVRVNIRMR